MGFLTTIPGMSEPVPLFTTDIKQNRQSIKKIADLEPKVVGIGHGPALYDPKQLISFAKRLNA